MRQIAAIVPAAGKSKRMGRSKPLLPLADRPVIRWSLDPLLDAGIQEIVVVLGPGGREIATAIQDLPVNIVLNSDQDSDMAGSVRTGLREIAAHSTAVLVCLVDHPLVSSGTIREIINAHIRHPGKIIIPAHEGRKGHPTLFPREIINELFNTPTLLDIVRKDLDRQHLIEVPDEGVLADMDTPAEYQKILAKIPTPREL